MRNEFGVQETRAPPLACLACRQKLLRKPFTYSWQNLLRACCAGAAKEHTVAQLRVNVKFDRADKGMTEPAGSAAAPIVG